jgi:phage-related protein
LQYKITFDLPNLSKGQGVAVNGLGEFKNGRSYTITDEQHDQYRAFNSVQIDGEEPGQVITKPGPTLLQSKFQDGITVEKVNDEEAAGKHSEEPSAAPAEKTVEGAPQNAKPDATVPSKGGKP